MSGVAPQTGPVDNGRYWGHGVTDPDAVRVQMENLLNRRTDDIAVTQATGMFSVMTWQQAALVYRTTSSALLKTGMCKYVIGGNTEWLIGMTQERVISILGQPDAISSHEIIYTGEGSVSDSMTGYVFDLDVNGKIDCVTPAK